MISPEIGLNDRVTLHYRLACGDAELVNTFNDAPETFQFGRGEIDPRLEYALKGLTTGTHTTLHLTPAMAFGEHDPDRVQAYPRADLNDLAADSAIDIGHRIQFQLPNGQALHAAVLALDATTATLDFNHPLAGQAVEFEVHILSIEAPRHD